MTKDYKALIQKALNDGYTISVHDGVDWSLIVCNDYEKIIAEIDNVEIATIRIRENVTTKIDWATILPYEQGEDSIADYGDNGYINKFMED